MPKTSFVSGSVVSPAWFNAMQDIVFDDQAIDGHYARLTDSALANTAGNIRYDFRQFQTALQVTAATGLIVNYNAGTVTNLDGTITTISAGQISLPASSTSYVFVNTSGVVTSSTVYPVRALMLAQVVTNATAIVGNIIDLRPQYSVRPIAQSIRIFGASGSQGAYNLTSGSDTLQGEYYFSSFNVSAGATLTVNGTCTIYCTGNVTIAGTVNVTAPVKGGAAYNGVLSNQAYPGLSGFGFGGGDGVNASPSVAYHFGTSPVGSGGCGGWINVTSGGGGTATFTGIAGGNGGGNFIVEAAGTITISGTINANGGDGVDATSIVMSPANSYVGNFTGSGGGSGGLIFLKSLQSITVTAAGVLSVKGGRGGNGYVPANYRSAGGGGGGWVALYSPNNNTSGSTINLAGGTVQYTSAGLLGSVTGGSYAGTGGQAGQAGSTGQLVLRSIIPV